MHGGGARALAAAFVLALLAAAPAASEVVCSGRRYAANSSFDASLQQVTRTLPGNASSSPLLFATLAVAGEAYALALCQGGTSAGSCNFCVAQTMRDGEHACAGDADVAMYDDICTVRFSDRDFLAATTNSPEKLVVAGSQSQKLVPSAAGRFYRLVGELLDATADYAVANSTARFATGDVGVGGYFDGEPFSKIYALAQCTPDLTPAQCGACLASAMEEMTRQVFAASSPGGKVIGERCGLRFEVFSFYTAKRNQPRKKRLPTKTPLIENTEDLEDFESIFIDLSTLQSATSNFDESNRLGEGGFGVVFKGVFPDGQEVAVKRLSNCSNQGLGQLKNELSLVAKLQHKNLVRLIGVCLEEGEKVLVYEYMPNKSLDTVLFDPEKSKQLDWGKRYNILYGIARGLQYLHEHSQLKIIHRDLKASNILLDSDMKPKIADFGMAKIFGDDQTRNATSRVVGTLGYMSPEYAMRGQYSTKLDVFSFGVLVLEIVTGRRNKIVDPSLGNHYPRGDILKCINIGLLCVQQNPVDRPPMSAIILMLSSGTVTLQAPYRPAYIFGRNRSYTETMDVPLPSGPHSSITELEPR
uniref:Uncharacterized protein n=1 Tax=Oryza glumipatula TaxID=40148 RepID=A0A0E0AN15_9ORYZ